MALSAPKKLFFFWYARQKWSTWCEANTTSSPDGGPFGTEDGSLGTEDGSLGIEQAQVIEASISILRFLS